VLVARHENEISGTTDVAAHPAFAGRRTTRLVDGAEVTGWFTEDFTLEELRTLRAVERIPAIRPANAAFDGRFGIPTFAEIIALARREGVGIYPETKHPTRSVCPSRSRFWPRSTPGATGGPVTRCSSSRSRPATSGVSGP
jgi:glycerophosphoryl diester phosphodiesterase